MATPTVDPRLEKVHPQMLRAQGESDPQALGKRHVGGAIEKALRRAGIEKQAAAFTMGYTDASVVGRWIAHTETPQFAKLKLLGDVFWCELLFALAEGVSGLEKHTQLVLRRPA